MSMGGICLLLSLFLLLWCVVEVHSQTAAVTISKSRSGPVYAGTECVLTADISLSGVNGDISLNMLWIRENGVIVIIVNDSRTTVSAISGSGDNYTASLTYSPITISDSGQITANVTVTLSSVNKYLTATGTESLNVQGIHIPIIDLL